MPETTDDVLASRRRLLAGAGAAGVIAAGVATGLAGCGSSPSSGSTGMGSDSGASTDASPAAPASMAAGAGGGDQTTSVNLGKTSHIPVGSGKIFKADKVVVTQPTAGKFKAFTAICTHKACTVSTISHGVIKCPCHGSQFSIEDGSVKGGPAPAPLAEKTVTVKNGSIVVT